MVSGANFGCLLHHFSSPTRGSGSRGQVRQETGQKQIQIIIFVTHTRRRWVSRRLVYQWMVRLSRRRPCLGVRGVYGGHTVLAVDLGTVRALIQKPLYVGAGSLSFCIVFGCAWSFSMGFRPGVLPSRTYFRVCVSVAVFLSTSLRAPHAKFHNL